MKHGAREDHASPQRDRVGDQSWSICSVSVGEEGGGCSRSRKGPNEICAQLDSGSAFQAGSDRPSQLRLRQRQDTTLTSHAVRCEMDEPRRRYRDRRKGEHAATTLGFASDLGRCAGGNGQAIR